MMSFIVGISNLLIGLAYAGLGLLSAWETISLHRYRGWSRFGIGFALMAASCGPHHLVHGWHVLQGASVSWPMLAVTLIGLPAGLTFVYLRFETVWGGQGDRSLTVSPQWVVLLVGILTLVAGWLSAWTFVESPDFSSPFQFLCGSSGAASDATSLWGGIDVASLDFAANVFVTITYGMVGWYLADHQARRYLTEGAWSLSGIALSGVFFTCAQMHFVNAVTPGDSLRLAVDLIGIPASVYFLWIVKQVHSDSVLDWNRRPLVGTAGLPARRSPWSADSSADRA